jgi:hypothetical protein
MSGIYKNGRTYKNEPLFKIVVTHEDENDVVWTRRIFTVQQSNWDKIDTFLSELNEQALEKTSVDEPTGEKQ